MGDFNIDLNKTDCINFGELEKFCDKFNLINIVQRNTRFTKNKKSRADLFLTNKPVSFQVTNTTETGVSDCKFLVIINSLRSKIVDAGEVFGKLQLDYFVLSETKQDDSFPSAQFYIEKFEIRN